MAMGNNRISMIEITKAETLTISLDITTMAMWFCELDDEQQADFFIKVAEHTKNWPNRAEMQWLRVGGHLRTCACSTDDARELINSLHYGLTNA